ncbi:unnamed protein product [Leptidea sinapis]|uniref:Amidase domain-containing protein n=1 Tax=Leptidea sinapis TaxID=189913 RepID=A0A5E4Q1I5_9NEOP|nr:unnamed protein product [Leptidea sinapis]
MPQESTGHYFSIVLLVVVDAEYRFCECWIISHGVDQLEESLSLNIPKPSFTKGVGDVGSDKGELSFNGDVGVPNADGNDSFDSELFSTWDEGTLVTDASVQNTVGLHQTAGVVLRRDYICEEDADAIKLLRAKGAVIIGTTNVPEACMW